MPGGLLGPAPIRGGLLGEPRRDRLAREMTHQANTRPQMGLLDALALATSPVPVLGDLTGLAADARMYAQEPQSRTWGNFAMTAAGALPFVPGAVAGTLRTANKVSGTAKEAMHANNKIRLYHGAAQDFDKFDPSRLNTLSERGAAAYLTDSADEARWYVSGVDNSPWGLQRQRPDGGGSVLEFSADDLRFLDEMEPAGIVDEAGQLTPKGQLVAGVVDEATDGTEDFAEHLNGRFRAFSSPSEAKNFHLLDYLAQITDDAVTTDAVGKFVKKLGFDGTVSPSIGKVSRDAKDYAVFALDKLRRVRSTE